MIAAGNLHIFSCIRLDGDMQALKLANVFNLLYFVSHVTCDLARVARRPTMLLAQGEKIILLLKGAKFNFTGLTCV